MTQTVELGAGSIVEILRRSLRRKKLAAGVAILCMAAGSAYVLGLQPLYKADALVLLPTASVDDTRTTAGVQRTGQADPFLIQSEMDVMTSDEVVRRVIDRLDLQDEPTFRSTSLLSSLAARIRGALVRSGMLPPPSSATGGPWSAADIEMDRTMTAYRDGFGAYNDGRSLSAHLSFSSPDPKLAAAIVNAHADAYVGMQTTRRTAAQQRIVDLISQELSAREAELASAEAAARAGSLRSGDDAADGGRAAALDQAVRVARGDVAQTRARLQDAQASLRSGVLQSAQFSATDAKVGSAAGVPVNKSFPRTGLFLAMVAILSCAAGLAVALVAEARSGGVAHKRHLLRSAGVKVLASMGLRTSRWGFGGRKRKARFWEQVRFVRDSLSAGRPVSGVVLVTSAAPGEGKSIVASALAQTLAAAGRRTLLVEADFRRVAAKRPVRRHVGLSDVLAGRVGFGEAYASSSSSSMLFLMSRGTSTERVDLLASERLDEVVSEMKDAFDVVVVDSPPLFAVSDALLLAFFSDKVVLVAKDDTPDHLVERVLEQFEDAQVVVAGAVLTGADVDLDEGLSGRQRTRYPSGAMPDGVQISTFPVLDERTRLIGAPAHKETAL